MVEISRKIYEIIGAETIVDNDIILWLKEKHIEKQLDHKTLRVATAKYFTDYWKNRYELADKPKKTTQMQINTCK